MPIHPVPNLFLLLTSDNHLNSPQHIPNKITPILDSTTNPNQIIPHPGLFPLLPRNPSMRHTSRDLNQTLHAPQTLRQRENPRRLAKPLRGLLPPDDPKTEHPPTHPLPVLLPRHRALRMRLQTGIIHAQNVGAGDQRLGDHGAVPGRFPSAQMQGLEAAVREPAVEGRGHSTDRVLQERQPRVELWVVEGCYPH